MSTERFPFAAIAPQDEERIRQLWARAPINLYRILAHQPKILRAWTEWNNELRHSCELPRSLRELVFLRSALLQDSEYEWTQHVTMARRAGVAEEKIDAIAIWSTSTAYDDRERLVLSLTDDVTRGKLDDASFAALRAAFTQGELIELIVTASHAAMLARVIQAIGVTTAGEEPAP